MKDVLKNKQLLPIIFFTLMLILSMGCKKEEPPLVDIEDFKTVATLPSVISESSGLLVTSINEIWSHNDKGGTPQLYAFDKQGTLLNTLTITNATNVDWEDLTQDKNGNVYISDSGNNENDRENLRIYKIGNLSINQTTVEAEIINFSLEGQQNFPPADDNLSYDVEALIATGDSLYLFTRDRTNPFLGETNLYVLPQLAGNHIAQFRGNFKTNSVEKRGGIRGAAISPDESRVALLSKTDVWVFTDFTNNDFFNGTVIIKNLPSETQKEGIDFYDNCHVYISDERGNEGGKLYELNTCLY